VRWAGHIAFIGERKMHTIFWLDNLMGRDHLEVTGICRRIFVQHQCSGTGAKKREMTQW